MQFIQYDGGREKAGFTGKARDCVCRSIAIASGKDYAEIYAALAEGNGNQRQTAKTKGSKRSARNGIQVGRKWFKAFMQTLGFRWVSCMGIGTGCTVHLTDGELPSGRLVVSLSKHYTSVVYGVIYDTHDPQRSTFISEGGTQRVAHRCVYGYWIFEGQ